MSDLVAIVYPTEAKAEEMRTKLFSLPKDAPPTSTTCSALDVSSRRASSSATNPDAWDIAPVKARPSSGFSA